MATDGREKEANTEKKHTQPKQTVCNEQTNERME